MNPQNYPMSLIRTQGTDRPAQVRVENCFMRGASVSMIEYTGGVAEVAVVRSVLVGGQGPLIVSTTSRARRASGAPRPARGVVVGRGPGFLELTSQSAGSRLTPVEYRPRAPRLELKPGSRSEEPTSLIFFHDDVGSEAKDLVNWQGEQNVFRGMERLGVRWSNRGIRSEVVHTGRRASSTWPGTDARRAQELPGALAAHSFHRRWLPEQMKTLAPQSLATLVGVTPPWAFHLAEKTIEEFKRPEIPGYVSPIPNEAPARAGVHSRA